MPKISLCDLPNNGKDTNKRHEERREMIDTILAADTAVLLFIQEHIRCGLLDFIMVFFSRIGDAGAVWLVSGMVLFISRKYRKAGFDIIVAVGICWIINEILKNIAARPRPFNELEQLTTVIVNLPSSLSFPSGHTCSSFAAAYVYARCFEKRGAWAYTVAVLISVSRAYIGVHYPTDIIAGAVLGTAGAAVVYSLSKKYVKIPSLTEEDSYEHE